MKLVNVGDCHFGVRSGDQNFLDFQKGWFDNVLLPYCLANRIDTIIQSGDWFDVRSHMKINVMHEMIHWLPKTLHKHGIRRLVIFVGNHDIYYRDNNDLTGLDLLSLIGEAHNIEITIVKDSVWNTTFGGKSFAFCPWINKNNQERLLKEIDETDADYLYGHFDMVGMPMYRGVLADHGLDPDSFNKFKRVISGHYHTVSNYKNIQYLGTPIHLTWMDYPDGTERGFWILDTEDDSFELIRNEEHMTMFAEIKYDPKETYDDLYFSNYAGNLVKVYVTENTDEKHFKKFTGLLSKAQFLDYKIVDTTKVIIERATISEDALKTSTLSSITEYIEKQEELSDKDAVKEIAKSIYLEAMNQ